MLNITKLTKREHTIYKIFSNPYMLHAFAARPAILK